MLIFVKVFNKKMVNLNFLVILLNFICLKFVIDFGDIELVLDFRILN